MISLEQNEVRVKIADLLQKADKARKDKKPEGVINGFCDEIDQLPGLEIVERRDFLRDRTNTYDCTYYVFQNEPWFQGKWSNGLPWEYWALPLDSLKGHGFEEIKSPRKGDIVIYTGIDKDDFFQHHFFKHVGMYEGTRRGDQWVRSKFSYSHIFLHNLVHVPSNWGDQAHFLRKATVKVEP